MPDPKEKAKTEDKAKTEREPKAEEAMVATEEEAAPLTPTEEDEQRQAKLREEAEAEFAALIEGDDFCVSLAETAGVAALRGYIGVVAAEGRNDFLVEKLQAESLRRG
jgi:hypothetical protein